MNPHHNASRLNSVDRSLHTAMNYNRSVVSPSEIETHLAEFKKNGGEIEVLPSFIGESPAMTQKVHVPARRYR